MSRPLAVIVLAAGLGKRTKLSTPKVLLPLCGRTLIGTVLDTVGALQPARTVVVLHHGREQVEAHLATRPDHDGLTVVDQGEPRGTGHAVAVACDALGDFDGDVMVVYGDVPLLTTATLAELRAARGDAAASLLTAFVIDPGQLGRVLRGEDGEPCGIREARDCSPDELEIDEINAGIYCFDATALRSVLTRLGADNAQGELYLTDTVALLHGDGRRVLGLVTDAEEETFGVNSLDELSVVRSLMQERILDGHLANGVLIEDPATTYIDHGVTIGPDTVILPCTKISAGVVIGAGCEVGPFSHLRPGTELAPGAEVGNFVEVKNSTLGAGAKAKHLTYLGDATVGARANIGAGTITANYDGRHKHRTEIGDGAFVGSGTVLVAPTRMASGSATGAGAIVTRGSELGEGETWVGVPARPMRSTGGSD